MNAANWEPNVGVNQPLINSLTNQLTAAKTTLEAKRSMGKKKPKKLKGTKNQIALANDTIVDGIHLRQRFWCR